MCSNACDCESDKLIENVRDTLRIVGGPLKKCRKCGAESFIVLDKVHNECRVCFLESCNKKVRSTIGKSKLLRNNDAVFIAYSGGPSSVALLSLIKNSIEYDARREQKFRPSILHIDTCAALGTLHSRADWTERRDKLKNLLASTHGLYPTWPIYWSTLELSELPQTIDHRPLYCLYDPRDDLNHQKYDFYLNNSEAYQALLLASENCRDLTDRQRHIQTRTNELINRLASETNSSFADPDKRFKFVFTGSSATQLANNLLVDVILGEGATIRSTVSVCDPKPAVPIVRPMRDFSKKEIVYYLKARDLEFHIQPNLSTLADCKASIQTVTEAFLSKLYVDYPATYSTLLRTGDKMQD